MPHKEVQSDLPEPTEEEEKVYLKAAERIKLHPKVPPEPSAYLRGSNYSRPWILQDGRAVDEKGSEMRGKYQVLPKIKPIIGIRKRMMTNFFWEQVLQEVISEIANPELTTEYCTEYDSNYKKEDFKPRLLEETVDKNMHLKYPLYGTGSSAVTFYSENIKKQGPGEILEKFRSCQYFTKPMAERLDNGWVL